MSIKFIIKLSPLFFTLVLSGCSSTNTSNVICDFAAGALDNAAETHQNKDQYNQHGQKVQKNTNSNILEGVLSIFSGMTNRALSSNDSENDEC